MLRVDEVDHLGEAFALLDRRDRRVVLVHLVGEVARDALRDEPLDLGGAREIVERPPEPALREPLLQADALGDFHERLIQDRWRSEARRART